MKISAVQTLPDAIVRLDVPHWRDRDDFWTSHFVSMKRTDRQAADLVPILVQEYLARPTIWPQGLTGNDFKTELVHYNYFFRRCL